MTRSNFTILSFDEERIEGAYRSFRLYGAIWGDGLSTTGRFYHEPLSESGPDFQQKAPPGEMALLTLLLFVINLKIAKRVWPSYWLAASVAV